MGKRTREHVDVFLRVYGQSGPWSCHWCHSDVTRTELIVHHLDENHHNNDPHNLAPIHRGCHAAIHHTGKPGYMRGKKHSAETRAKMSASQLKVNTGERGAEINRRRGEKVSAARRGRTGQVHDEETRRKIGIGARQTRLRERIQCGECDLISNAGAIGRHQSASGHRGRSILHDTAGVARGQRWGEKEDVA